MSLNCLALTFGAADRIRTRTRTSSKTKLSDGVDVSDIMSMFCVPGSAKNLIAFDMELIGARALILQLYFLAGATVLEQRSGRWGRGGEFRS